jgi:hypothetical protein
MQRLLITKAALPVLGILSTLVSLAPHHVLAGDMVPLAAADQSPFSLVFGLPTLGAARILSSGQQQANVSYEISNYIFYDARASESLVIDGETHRASAIFVFGAASGEWGIEVPYLSHSGGALDGFIRRWHDTFDHRQGGRDTVPDNLLSFRYRRNGTDLIDIHQSSEGIGDIRLFAGWNVPAFESTDIALRTSLKLPTGDAARLHGSGAADVAAWAVAACRPETCNGRWGWNAGAGLLWLGHGDVLPQLQRRLIPFAGAGLNYAYWRSVTLKLGLYTHAPFYRHTAFQPLNDTSVQLLLGGIWAVTAATAIEVAITEDIKVYTAPDVGIRISVRSTF